MSEGDTLKEELLVLIESGEHKPVIKKIKNALYDTKLPHTEVYDIFGVMTQKDPEFFMTYIYPVIFKNRFRIFKTNDVVEMSKYILEQYCFLEGEHLKEIFMGHIYHKEIQPIQFNGTIFLTNYRINLVGDIVQTNPVSFGLISGLIKSSINARRRAMRDELARVYRTNFSSFDVGEWGYVFPITNAKYINRDKKRIWYRVEIGSKRVYHDTNISIEPYPYRVKKQTKEDHLKQKEYVINQIQQLLEKYQ